MNRRTFLGTTGGALSLAVAGCLGDTSGDPESSDSNGPEDQNGADPLATPSNEPRAEVRELLQSESRMISVDNPRSELFTATIQNTGHGGDITVALFWKTDQNDHDPETVASIFNRERKQTFYFDSDERRTIEMTAQPPGHATGYEFIAQASSYGANLRNTGDDGRFTVTIQYQSNTGIGTVREMEEEQNVFIGQGSEREVMFDVTVQPDSDWEVWADPL